MQAGPISPILKLRDMLVARIETPIENVALNEFMNDEFITKLCMSILNFRSSVVGILSWTNIENMNDGDFLFLTSEATMLSRDVAFERNADGYNFIVYPSNYKETLLFNGFAWNVCTEQQYNLQTIKLSDEENSHSVRLQKLYSKTSGAMLKEVVGKNGRYLHLLQPIDQPSFEIDINASQKVVFTSFRQKRSTLPTLDAPRPARKGCLLL